MCQVVLASSVAQPAVGPVALHEAWFVMMLVMVCGDAGDGV
jgi:hypothetical protein